MRSRSRLAGLTATLAGVVWPAVSWGETDGPSQKGGMPQLDPHSFASQLFWLAVFFILAFGFLNFIGIPRVRAIIAERRARIGGDLGAAESLHAQAAEARKAYEATMADAHSVARKLIAETDERNAAILSERTKAATVETDRQVGDAVKRIESARLTALQGIREAAVGLASEITVKLSGRVPEPEKVTQAVDAAFEKEAA